ncbi:hypothetical protein CSA56_14480 [candidate division KSB3 bacterium]|uniref:TonB-dependent receptor-like beta-barrel domain-containing protein n=1 Tax=candidate division KSB3 bacterium TaxID=2044937 RepID=A0A2G6KAJ6_9BACT|nr:MAG: hypothetical protein CSA56_14480 [candidate division KSB3 bacterium]
MIGGRLTVQAPRSGLNASLSAYTDDAEFGADIEGFDLADRYTRLRVSAEYLSARWWLRSEYLGQHDTSKIEAGIVYAERAYFLSDQWQAEIRYEHADFDISTSGRAYLPTFIVEHEEFVVGLNHWLNPDLIFKLSCHTVKGNCFATSANAEDYLVAALQGSFDETTHLSSLEHSSASKSGEERL